MSPARLYTPHSARVRDLRRPSMPGAAPLESTTHP
jgi:hypothetical protein